MFVLAKIVGHSSITITQHYVHARLTLSGGSFRGCRLAGKKFHQRAQRQRLFAECSPHPLPPEVAVYPSSKIR